MQKCKKCYRMFEEQEARYNKKEDKFGCYYCTSTSVYEVSKCAECREYEPTRDMKTSFLTSEPYCKDCILLEIDMINNQISRKELRKKMLEFMNGLKKEDEIEALKQQIKMLEDNSVYSSLKVWIQFQVDHILEDEKQHYERIMTYIKELEEKNYSK